MRPVCCLDGAAGFDAPQDLQERRRRDLGNGPDAQPREYVPLEAPDDLAGVPRRPARGVLPVSLPHDGLEAVFAAARRLRGLAGCARIYDAASCLRASSRLARASFRDTCG
jgi:hypothetical protein